MVKTMTSIECCRAAIELRKPDRVPVDLHNFQEVEATCKEAIEAFLPDGGFILGPGCALEPETPATISTRWSKALANTIHYH